MHVCMYVCMYVRMYVCMCDVDDDVDFVMGNGGIVQLIVGSMVQYSLSPAPAPSVRPHLQPGCSLAHLEHPTTIARTARMSFAHTSVHTAPRPSAHNGENAASLRVVTRRENGDGRLRRQVRFGRKRKRLPARVCVRARVAA